MCSGIKRGGGGICHGDSGSPLSIWVHKMDGLPGHYVQIGTAQGIYIMTYMIYHTHY